MDTEAQAKEGKGRKLGPARAVVFVVGSMVGAGIFLNYVQVSISR